MSEDYTRTVSDYILANKEKLGSERSESLLQQLIEGKPTSNDDKRQWIAGIDFMIEAMKGTK